MNLLFAYVDNSRISRAMAEIVNEELEHFQMVLDLWSVEVFDFENYLSNYGPKLHELIRKNEPESSRSFALWLA